MTYPADDLERDWQELDSLFGRFAQRRGPDGDWARLTFRKIQAQILPELQPYREGLDFRGSTLQVARRDWKTLLRSNPTRFDVHIHSESHQARETETAGKLFLANSWNSLNEYRAQDSYDAENIGSIGISVKRLMCKPIRNEMSSPTYYEFVLAEGYRYWGNPLNPTKAIYRYSLPLHDCGIKQDGKRITFDALGKVAWLGEHEPYDYTLNPISKKIHIIIADYEDPDGEVCPLENCDHIRRWISVYVCPDGKSVKDYGEEIETYPSPFMTCSFHATGGDINLAARDPDDVWQPLMAPLYPLQAIENGLTTELLALHRKEAAESSVYGDSSSANPQLMAQTLNAEGGPLDKINLVEESGKGDIPIAPVQLRRVPPASATFMKDILNLVRQQIQQWMPNSILTGSSDSLTSNSTSGNYVSTFNAASAMLKPSIENMDHTTKRWARDTFHAIAWHGYAAPNDEQPKFYATVSGSESTMTYGVRAAKGTRVSITPKMALTLLNQAEIVITTSALTWPEKRERRYTAVTGLKEGLYTLDDALRDWDFFDTEMQKELLAIQHIDAQLMPVLNRMVMLVAGREAAAETGIDFGSIIQEALGQMELVNQPQPDQVHQTGQANVARMTQPPTTGPAAGVQGGSQAVGQ